MTKEPISNEIITLFYVIYGDGIPIYVGTTNQSLERRLASHKVVKDFSDYNRVEIKEVFRDYYNFTWNIAAIKSHGNYISNKEAELVKRFNTQSSKYQKALGGGAAWGGVVRFIKENKALLDYLSEEEVWEYYLDRENTRLMLSPIVYSITTPKEITWINHMIYVAVSPYEIKMIRNFVANVVKSDYPKYVSSFVRSVTEPECLVWVRHLIYITISSKDKNWVKDFVSDNIIDTSKKQVAQYVRTITTPKEKVWVRNFTSNNIKNRK